MRKKVIRHYYWVIAAILWLEMAVYGGVLNNYNGLFVIPVTETLNISRTSFGVAIGMASVTSTLSNLLLSKMINRFGYRKLAVVLLLVGAVGIAMLAMSQNVAMLCIGAILIGLCGGVASAGGSTWLVRDWFHQRQGTILGVISAATGIGGSIFAILFAQVMKHAGWRSAYGMGAVAFVLISLLIALLIRNRPSQMRLVPYGEGTAVDPKHRVPDTHWIGFPQEKLKKMPALYLGILLVLLASFGVYLVWSIVIPHLQDNGMEQTVVASVQSVLMLGLCAGKIVLGYLHDRIGARWTTVCCLAFCCLGTIMLIMVQGTIITYVSVWVYAMGVSIVTMLTPLLVIDLFGHRGSTAYLGVFLALPPVANVFAPTISNMVYDLQGSYTLILWVAAALAVVSILLLAILSRIVTKARKAFKQDEDKCPQ